MAIYYIDKDHPSASNSNAGTDPNLPWLSFANMTVGGSVVVAGDTVLVRKTTTPYDLGASNDFENPAVQPANNGSAGNLITISKWGDDRPVVEISSGTSGAIGAGLQSPRKKFISWEHFEINMPGLVNKAAVLFDCDNCELHFIKVNGKSMTTTDNHDAFRIEGTNDAIVQDCEARDVKAGTSSPYDNSAAYKCYQNVRLLLEHCLARDCDMGLFDKGQGSVDNIFRRNLVVDCYWGMKSIQSPWDSPDVYENIFQVSGLGLGLDTGTNPHFLNLRCFNNVFYVPLGITDVVTLRGVGVNSTDLEFYNNIIHNVGGSRTIRHELTTGVLTHNRNCFQSAFSAQRHGTSYASLGTWQSGTGFDADSFVDDPEFVDLAGEDFHLQSTSPCKGTGVAGEDMGAYPRADSTVIGPRSASTTDPGRPPVTVRPAVFERPPVDIRPPVDLRPSVN